MIWLNKIPEKDRIHLRAWARKNYKPNGNILDIWHPIIQNECKKMDLESDNILSTCCRANTFVDIGKYRLLWRCAACDRITQTITLKKES